MTDQPPEREQTETTPSAAIEEMNRGRMQSLWRRLVLTYRYLGLRTLLYRLVTFPLRWTPLRHRLRLGRGIELEQARAKSWDREKGRPVTVVIPTYGAPDLGIDAVASIRKTTPRDMVQIVVADDASAPGDVARLRELEGVELMLGETNVGFA